jgi:FtsZ-binding cell division protein ZapB
MESNQVTKVTISGIEMTVLEAIERKASIEYEKHTLSAMKDALVSARIKMQKHNASHQKTLDSLLVAAASGNTLDKQTSDAITNNHLALNEMSMEFGSVNLPEAIAELEKSIEDFENEVDYVLSTSNATVTIEVE